MTDPPPPNVPFDLAHMTVLSHLYRGEVYRSKVWRLRLDTTTNWAIGATGIALSIAFSRRHNSPLPLLVTIVLVLIFLGMETRRYRYFDVWRKRVRMMEEGFFVPILRGEPSAAPVGWQLALADDYSKPQFHITLWQALGRRLRRNYIWILLVLGLSYFAKLFIHPLPLREAGELFLRARIGPIPGELVVAALLGLEAMAVAASIFSLRHERVIQYPEQKGTDTYTITTR